MKTSRVLIALGVVLILSAMPVHAQTAADAADVRQAQQALKSAGHDPGRIDGVMGPQTTAALKAYQARHGLTATGQLDAPTLARLGHGSNATAGDARPSPSSTQTGGDRRPSKVDPAQGNETGANVGEGASYSRSTEKGHSAEKDAKK
jgi:peptidoglycan hydrolase-like protein with peptidoglycan-binding domain